jgi:hypothetical protein
MMKTPQPSEVQAWAAARLLELERERTALLHLFPGLAAPSAAPRGRVPAPRVHATGARRGHMSAAARKAVSQRMKLYWAERRKQKGGGSKKAAAKN